jgi:hypothetical protein
MVSTLIFSTRVQLRIFAGRSEPACEAARTPAGAILLLAILTLGAASCRHHPVARVFVRPPSTPRPFVLPPSPQLPGPPEFDAKTEAETTPADFSEIPTLPPPPAPARRPPVIAAPRPAPPPLAVEPVPSPRLGQIFTADQLRDYNRAFDDSLARVRTVLAVAAGRRLNAQQNGIVARIRTFMVQAEQTRQQDLVTAVGLARRADLLAQDLSASLP